MLLLFTEGHRSVAPPFPLLDKYFPCRIPSLTFYSGRKAPSLKMQTFFFCRRRRRRRRRRRTFEIAQYGLDSNWLARPITLFARADHVWTKYSGQMT